jgi:hypothetical protein
MGAESQIGIFFAHTRRHGWPKVSSIVLVNGGNGFSWNAYGRRDATDAQKVPFDAFPGTPTMHLPKSRPWMECAPHRAAVLWGFRGARDGHLPGE